ncbi:STAS domain-containing protein [Allorhodopirellula solitaria]|uniref:STAS domain-containing protein n=1 Tax=Allorhodopirellula solitaria TaxID=2527987 RepID=A0A5C5XXT0_9BACT|nr:STAS domain-containing protein [Allorhodopirellula solitaria]TWT66382.1 hypothetical protein CA85_24760 [Allorhodopirellula solitaria]
MKFNATYTDSPPSTGSALGCEQPLRPVFAADNTLTVAQLRVTLTSLPLERSRSDWANQMVDGATEKAISHRRDVRVIQFPDRLSSSNGDTVARVFEDFEAILLRSEQTPIVLDLSSVRLCGASFINGLMASRNAIDACRATVVIAGDPNRLLSMFQVHRIIQVYPTLASALHVGLEET